jgi:Tfp pilus assembly protein PilN
MIHVEFLPERITRQRQRRRSLLRQGYMIAFFVLAMAAFGYVRQHQIQVARAECLQLEDQANSMDGQMALRTEYENQLAELLVIRRIDDQLGSRARALDIMGELQARMPRELTLTELRIESVAATAGPGSSSRSSRSTDDATSMSPVLRTRLIVRGVAPSDIEVANFIGQIASSPMFEDVRMGYSRGGEYRDCSVRQFELRLMVAR